MNFTKVLFVCMGNICRSPSAQGVFEKLIINKKLENKYKVDSAGTHSYHLGGRPDSRSMHFAQMREINISTQRARKICQQDFDEFDYIIAMDDDNFKNLIEACPSVELEVKIYKMMSFAPSSKYTQVPDPYYGEENGFDLVLDLLEKSCQSLLDELQNLGDKNNILTNL